MINAMTLILILLFFPFLDGDIPRRLSYGVYNSQLILALFGVLPMVPLVILPMVPLVANGTIGLPMVPKVPLGDQMVPLSLP